MNKKGSQLPFRISQRRSPDSTKLEVFLETLPYPAIILDLPTASTLFVNSKAVEYSGYTRSELTQLPVVDLVEDGQEFLPESSLTGIPRITYVTKRNKTKAAVKFVMTKVIDSDDRALIIMEPIHPQPGDLISPGETGVNEYMATGWNNLNALLEATQEHNLDTAIEQALKAAAALSEATLVAVYKAQNNIPLLVRYAGVGPTDILPENLPPQTLIQLSRPQQWTWDQKPYTDLHQAVKASGFSMLATAPIGQPGANSGLVLIGTAGNAILEHIPYITQVLATSITSIFHHHGWVENVQQEVQWKQLRLLEKSTLEEYMAEGIVILTPNLKIVAMNPAAEIFLGYAEREVIDQTVEKILIGTETLLPALAAAQQGSPTFNLGNVRLYRRNGEAFLALVRVFPVLDEGGELHRIIILLQDLHEEEAIRIRAQQLEQRAILGEVTAIFAHEVRNPINNISTGLQLMAMDNQDNTAFQEAIHRMLQDCDRLEELIKSVLAYARPTDYVMESLDLVGLLKNLLDRLHPRISRLNVDYNLQFHPNCPQASGNLRALEQVFSNLINNALQAMSESGGRLGIKVQPINTAEGLAFLEVSVADSGPGIPPEIHEKIFQPFFTTQRNGTGLGLAITKRIITAHKGNIRLISVPGGTVFHVRIPQANPGN